jgi:hypothetical protein
VESLIYKGNWEEARGNSAARIAAENDLFTKTKKQFMIYLRCERRIESLGKTVSFGLVYPDR